MLAMADARLSTSAYNTKQESKNYNWVTKKYEQVQYVPFQTTFTKYNIIIKHFTLHNNPAGEL